MSEFTDELRSRINPTYANQIGTESYERRICAEFIERMEENIERLENEALAATIRIDNDLMTIAELRDEVAEAEQDLTESAQVIENFQHSERKLIAERDDHAQQLRKEQMQALATEIAGWEVTQKRNLGIHCDLIAERDALASEVAALKALSVTNIMIDVVPGWDGMGHEVYAKSIKEIEDLLTKMGAGLEDAASLKSEVAALKLDAEKLTHDNHNLNWAIGTEGYAEMYTPEERDEHKKSNEKIKAFADRLKTGNKRMKQLRADAARYKWLREMHNSTDESSLWHVRGAEGKPIASMKLDEAIDAAMGGVT